MESCLYEGWVRHRRVAPRHAFTMPLFMTYLDLDELEDVFRGRWLWSTSSPALAWFRRADHFGDPAIPLAHAVRTLVADRLGRRPEGPIRLLTHLRYAGYIFNPVSLFYCFDRAGTGLEAVVADVTNTPWGERHQYVVPLGGTDRARLRKAFHVSPFMPMAQDYEWRFGTPDRQLAVRMVNREAGRETFDATLWLERRPLTSGALARVLVRYPALTARVTLGIYWQALRLLAKGTPFHPHPRHSRPPEARP
ncbi:MAG: DUF1365 domain-containing protein [Acidobacteria bacterium]|nr:DUF1365 domain-containing protein [Acidobacteriota bacterium]